MVSVVLCVNYNYNSASTKLNILLIELLEGCKVSKYGNIVIIYSML